MAVTGSGHLTGSVAQGYDLQGNASGAGHMTGSLATAYAMPGKDGGYYIPKITQEDDGSILISYERSNNDMPPIDDIRVDLQMKGVIPEGGKAGQFLCKKSDDDYDVEWADFEIPEQYGLVTYDQDRTITIT